jgi:magnesium transporter
LDYRKEVAMEEIIDKIQDLLKEKKFFELKKYLENIEPEDIAIILNEVSEEECVIIYRLLNKDVASDVFVELDSDIQEKLIGFFTDKELKEVLDEIFLDDTADIIEEMPANVVKRILKNIDKNDRKIVNELLKYPEDSAGSIMTPEFIDFKEDMTIKDAFDKIRRVGEDKENIYTGYVLTKTRKILGKVDVEDMILANDDDNITEIMKKDIIVVNTYDDQEEVVKKLEKYDEFVLPVVDTEERLVGIITVDDAIDVMQEETEEDFEVMAAVTPSDESYFKTSVLTHAKNRFVWLLLLMISSTLSGAIINHYESAFAALPILVAFLPMIMDTGGNCGSQASTLIIRGLATDEIKMKDIFKVIWKEFRVALIVGVILALVNGIRIYIQYRQLNVAFIVSLTLICTVVLSKLIGCTFPIVAKKIKLDPAIMAAPLISTIVDSTSVFIFFNIALLIIGKVA